MRGEMGTERQAHSRQRTRGRCCLRIQPLSVLVLLPHLPSDGWFPFVPQRHTAWPGHCSPVAAGGHSSANGLLTLPSTQKASLPHMYLSTVCNGDHKTQ